MIFINKLIRNKNEQNIKEESEKNMERPWGGFMQVSTGSKVSLPTGDLTGKRTTRFTVLTSTSTSMYGIFTYIYHKNYACGSSETKMAIETWQKVFVVQISCYDSTWLPIKNQRIWRVDTELSESMYVVLIFHSYHVCTYTHTHIYIYICMYVLCI